MHKLVQPSRSNRRLVTVVAIGALLATLFLVQFPALRGTAASSTLPVLTPCATAAIGPDLLTPRVPGTAITLTASSTGCDNPVFRYLLLAPGTTTWAFMTDYTSSRTYSFDTTKAKLGVWQIGVWARDIGSGAKYDTYGINTVTISIPYCTGTYLQEAPITGEEWVIHISGDVFGCTDYSVQFWMLAPGSTTWVPITSYYHVFYSTNISQNWDTTGLRRGVYQWGLWARQTISTHSYDTYTILSVTLN